MLQYSRGLSRKMWCSISEKQHIWFHACLNTEDRTTARHELNTYMGLNIEGDTLCLIPGTFPKGRWAIPPQCYSWGANKCVGQRRGTFNGAGPDCSQPDQGSWQEAGKARAVRGRLAQVPSSTATVSACQHTSPPYVSWGTHYADGDWLCHSIKQHSQTDGSQML